MRAALYLALAYVRFHGLQSAALIVAVALILSVPLATRLVLRASELAFGARAAETPLLIGARGGGSELVLNALYFTDARSQTVPQKAEAEVWDSGLATAIPLHVRFHAGGQPVVGTSLDYFDHRGIEVAEGRQLGLLGEAVLGAAAARRLGLTAGGSLLTDPETLFDFTGAYPLELSVVGVLAPTGGPDDGAVFVDLRTAWVMEGIGHGHEDVTPETALEVGASGGSLTADPAIRQFTRITPDNIESFHFHGDTSAFPISAVIAAPHDSRAATILEGRYLESGGALEALRPSAVIADLLATLFRVGRLIDAAIAVAALSAALSLGVAIYLTLALRRSEIDTMFRLGAQRMTMARMLAAQIGLILLASALLAATLVAPVAYLAEDIALRLVGGGPS